MSKKTQTKAKENVKKETSNKKKETVKKETAVSKKETTKKTAPKKTEEKKPAKKEAVKKEAVKKEAPKETTEAKSKAPEFTSMCGAKFNSSPDSTCFLMCKVENKSDFEACLSNYEEMLSAKPEKKLKRRKKNKDFFGDGIGTSASMINELLICGASIEEIKQELDVKESRIRGHFNGLRTRGQAFELTKDKETNRWFFDMPELPYYGDISDGGCLPVSNIKKKAKASKKAPRASK